MTDEQGKRPDVQWWHVRCAVAAALRLANNYDLGDLLSELTTYEHNIIFSGDQPQDDDMREALFNLVERCREVGLEPRLALGKIEEEYGPRPDPDRMILPPPGYGA